MLSGTGGLGSRRAMSSSSWRLLFLVAKASSSRWLASVKRWESIRRPERCTRPERYASRMAGNLAASLATVIRFEAASSDRPSSCTQKANREGKARVRYSLRSSISTRWARRSASMT